MRQVLATARQLLKQPVTYFGLVLIAGVWAAALQQSALESKTLRHEAANNTANIARVFEQNVIRSLSEVDLELKHIRQLHAHAGSGMNWQTAVSAYTASEQTPQLAVISRNGVLIASNLGPQPPKPVDLSDREHFRVHQNSPVDILFVSKPVIGRASGKPSIQITRRIDDPGGSFGGVLVASLDPAYFARSYSSLSLGQDGGIALIGKDGVIRAGAGMYASSIGVSIKDEPVFKSFLDSSEAAGIEGTTVEAPSRILSMRPVQGYPLFVLVARGDMAADALWRENRWRYFAGAAILSLIVFGVAARVLQSGMRVKRAQLALARSEESEKQRTRELELTLSRMKQGIVMVDASGQVAVMNQRYGEMIDLPERLQKRGTAYRDIVTYLESVGEFRDGSAKIAGAALEYIKSSLRESPLTLFERVRPNGTVLEVETAQLSGGGFVRTLTDITGRRRQEAEIFHMSRHDPLTELGNRTLLDENLDRALSLLDGTRQIAFHVIDLDRFKPVNDTFGHPVGDNLLKIVAERLRMNLRQGDIVARLGGDEFAVVEMNDVSRRQSEKIARRLCAILSKPYEVGGQRLEISASIGVALAPQDGGTAAELLEAADLALYAAKAEGRGTYRFYNADIEKFAQTRREMEAGLRTALANGRLELHYHAINGIAQPGITGYEALIRWRDPRRGLIQPAEFVSVAEDAGLIIPIGAWVLRKACADMALLPGTLRVSVNLSPVQLRDPSLVTLVREALEAPGLDPSRLEIEVTESALMHDDELVTRQLQELRSLGIGIAMDDFGTGYSSLSYLQTHPVDRIKIDRSFIGRIGEDRSSEAIVKAIVALSAALGIRTIAEGVETIAQLRALAEIGCSEAQGFYFGQPQPGGEIFRRRDVVQRAPERMAG